MAGLELVRVVWADAHSGPQEWQPLESLELAGEYLVESVGHLVPVTQGGKVDHVTLAQSITPEAHVDHVIYIPLGMVRSMETLTSRIHAVDSTHN